MGEGSRKHGSTAEARAQNLGTISACSKSVVWARSRPQPRVQAQEWPEMELTFRPGRSRDASDNEGKGYGCGEAGLGQIRSPRGLGHPHLFDTEPSLSGQRQTPPPRVQPFYTGCSAYERGGRG